MNKKKVYMKLFWDAPVLTVISILLYCVFIWAVMLGFARVKYINYSERLCDIFRDRVAVIPYEDNTADERRSSKKDCHGGSIFKMLVR